MDGVKMRIARRANEAACYVEHAKEINDLARRSLCLEARNATFLAKKISLGLSLQAIELAGKGILFYLGESIDDIRKNHKNHALPVLLKSAESLLQQKTESVFRKYDHFTLWSPTIDGVKFNTTISAYLSQHFSKGASARPRSYFYPDEPVFTGPAPIQAVYIMADHLIEVASEIRDLVEHST